MDADVGIDFDIKEFEQAIDEMRQEVPTAEYMILTATAQSFLVNAVKAFPVRTGNLRSAALPVWRHLDIPGRPLTMLEDGEKVITMEERGRRYIYKVRSAGSFDDQRRRQEDPYFSYNLFAAEWRDNKGHNYGSILELLKTDVLGMDDARELRKLLAADEPWEEVWNLIVEALSKDPAGIGWLIGNGGGGWRPYQQYFKGNRKVIDDAQATKWLWNDYHAKILQRHSGQ